MAFAEMPLLSLSPFPNITGAIADDTMLLDENEFGRGGGNTALLFFSWLPML